MKYQVGDKVKIREDLNVDADYGCDVAFSMLDFAGTICTIRSVSETFYSVEENDFFWTDKMFEDVISFDSFTKANLKDGMIVELKNGQKGIVLGDRIVCADKCYRIGGFANDLENYTESSLDIVKVFRSVDATSFSDMFNTNNLKLIWEKNTGYNGKVVCVDNAGIKCWTIGKIYQFVDGITKADDGMPTQKFASFKEFNNIALGKWLEIVQ